MRVPGRHFYSEGENELCCWMGSLEAEVMDVVWSRPGQIPWAVKDIHRWLGMRGVERAYTTTLSVVCRLTEKGILVRQDSQPRRRTTAAYYLPAMSFDEFVSSSIRRVIDRMMSDRPDKVIRSVRDAALAAGVRLGV